MLAMRDATGGRHHLEERAFYTQYKYHISALRIDTALMQASARKVSPVRSLSDPEANSSINDHAVIVLAYCASQNA
jgi:hypothetical protein